MGTQIPVPASKPSIPTKVPAVGGGRWTGHEGLLGPSLVKTAPGSGGDPASEEHVEND